MQRILRKGEMFVVQEASHKKRYYFYLLMPKRKNIFKQIDKTQPKLSSGLKKLILLYTPVYESLLSLQRLASKLFKKTIEETKNNSGDNLMVKDNISYNAINAILPISVLVISMFYFIFSSGEGESIKDILGSADTFSALMHSTLLSAFAAAAMSVGQKILSLNETFEAWYSGLKFMLMGLLVLVLAWALADISKELHTADYIVSVLGDKIPLEICLLYTSPSPRD